MKPVLGPHERYLVVRARSGWSVNLGADQLQFFDSRAGARNEAQRLVDEALAGGRNADWVDVGEDHPEGIA
jgi:hypothetical protein